MSIEIKHSPQLNGSPAFQFAMKAYANFTRPELDTLIIHKDCELIYAVDYVLNEENIVGVIIIDIRNENPHIIKSYVSSEARMSGIMGKMWAFLVNYSVACNYKRITSQVGVDNKIMQKILAKQERKIVAHIYEYKV